MVSRTSFRDNLRPVGPAACFCRWGSDVFRSKSLEIALIFTTEYTDEGSPFLTKVQPFFNVFFHCGLGTYTLKSDLRKNTPDLAFSDIELKHIQR